MGYASELSESRLVQHTYSVKEQGTTDRTGMEELLQEANILQGKINDLRHLGIESADLPLPKICVVGDQSTGKSSIIEGIR